MNFQREEGVEWMKNGRETLQKWCKPSIHTNLADIHSITEHLFSLCELQAHQCVKNK